MQKHTFKLVLSMIALALCLGPATALRAEDDKPKDLAAHMEVINKNMKKLKKDVADSAKNESSAKLAGEACAAAAAAKEMVPAKAKEIPADKREKFVAEYKAMMENIPTYIERKQGLQQPDYLHPSLEAALKEGKNDEAQKLYDTLMGMKKTGHDKFTE